MPFITVIHVAGATKPHLTACYPVGVGSPKFLIRFPTILNLLPVDDHSTHETGRSTDARGSEKKDSPIPTETGFPPDPLQEKSQDGIETVRPQERSSDSPWAPLHVPIFKAFWIASLVSNLGTWAHEVGAGWLMTSLDPSPQMVAAVRIAIAGPTMFLAIPAGVIADRVDRRQLLIMTQLMLLATTSLLSVLTFAGSITSWSLLGLTFVIGMGVVLHVLTWQSTIPVLVPKPQIARAIALGSISFNLARAAGPAIGGVLIALAGPGAAFAANALSFAGVLAVLLFWKRERTEFSHGMSYRAALKEGFVYVIRQRTMRNVLIGLLMFVLPATALWSLLPLVARHQLGWHVQGYGMLVTAIGLGAVVAARVLHALHRRLFMDRTVAAAMVVFAFGLAVLGTTSGTSLFHTCLAIGSCVIMGSTWMISLTTLNATAQMTLPDRLRARAMGCYMTTMATAMTLGSFVWGQVAGHIGLQTTQWAAAATLIVAAAASFFFPIDQKKSKRTD